MDNVQLRNLYVKKIAKSVNNLEQKINLLSELDKAIYSQTGGDDTAIKTEVGSDIMTANDNLLNLKHSLEKLQKSSVDVGDIHHKLVFLAGEVQSIKDLSENINTDEVSKIIASIQSGADGLPNPPAWWTAEKDNIVSGDIDNLLAEIKGHGNTLNQQHLYLSTLVKALAKAGKDHSKVDEELRKVDDAIRSA
uniref:Uncharacterized protein n=1 Tax=viral metagenome TaxID=1070528 RepID=A0A6C0DAC6_9ZZZZ